jgi:hypothetical protein
MEANVAAESIDEEQVVSHGSQRLLQVLRKPEGFSGEPYYTHLNSSSKRMLPMQLLHFHSRYACTSL